MSQPQIDATRIALRALRWLDEGWRSLTKRPDERPRDAGKPDDPRKPPEIW